jgi:hypothetical protein
LGRASMQMRADLLQFCADATKKICGAYERSCIYPEDAATGGFPRSVDDLQWLISGETGWEIFHRELQVSRETTAYRSFYVPFKDHNCCIYYSPGLDVRSARYFRTKELMQILLMRDDLTTVDIVGLVHDSIVKDSPEGRMAELDVVIEADTLGDIAAMEFLFPHKERLKYVNGERKETISEIAKRYGIPDFVVQRCFNNMGISDKYFGDAASGGG